MSAYATRGRPTELELHRTSQVVIISFCICFPAKESKPETTPTHSTVLSADSDVNNKEIATLCNVYQRIFFVACVSVLWLL